MAARSSRTCFARTLSVRSSAIPESAMSRTSLRMMARETTGFSVSTGKVVIASIRFRISSRATFVSAPVVSSIATPQVPSTAVERIFSTFSVPSTASSMRTQTPSATSSGAAPR